MKILVIGDPHGRVDLLRKIPIKKADLILVTGDLGRADLARKRAFENIERKKKGLKRLDETSTFVRQVHNQIHSTTLAVLKYLSNFAPVYTLQGNVSIPSLSEIRKNNHKHGLKLSATSKTIDKMTDVKLVKNALRIIGGLRIGFLEYFVDSCWVKEFKPSKYQQRMKNAKKQTEKAREIMRRFGKIDIFIFHQPPYGILDKVGPPAPRHWRGKHAGSRVILDYIKKYQPLYAFCGHIHEGKGHKKIGKTHLYNLGVAGYKMIEL